MVVKRIQGAVNGNLNNSQDHYGNDADVIYVLDGQPHEISTFANNDIVDFRQNAFQNQTVAIFTGFGDDIVYGSTGTQYVYDGSGNDQLYLGEGIDTIGVCPGNDIYDGGSDKDLLMFYWTTYEGYEYGYSDNRTGVSVDLAITTRQDFGIYGFDIIRNFEAVKGGNGNDIIRGTSGDNEFTAVAGNDIIYGRDGNDFLRGGEGYDKLIGGKGADKYYYDTVAECHDLVRQFEAADSFVFNGAAFANLVTGTLATNAFHSGTSNVATAASQRFIYRTTDDTLWYDSNGSASGGTKVQVADMQYDSVVTHSDIIIV